MPPKPKRECAKPGCRELSSDRFCDNHGDEIGRQVRERKRVHDKLRGTAHSRGYTCRWAKARGSYIKSHPFCVRCKDGKGLSVMADVVDHIVPHKGNMKLFWDRDNWQSLCKRCHDSKTAREDGGFASSEYFTAR